MHTTIHAKPLSVVGMVAVAAVLIIAAPSAAANDPQPPVGDHAATITLEAAQGQTLAGHTFDAYRIGDYHDVVVRDDAVVSFGVRGTDETNAWASDAIDTYNQNAAVDVIIPVGYDAAGTVASLAGSADAAAIRGVATALAASELRPEPTASDHGAGEQLALAVDEGYYLVVDSAGMPVLIGTTIDGKHLTDMTLGAAVIKSTIIDVDKRVGADGETQADDGSATVGSTVVQTIVTSVPNSRIGGALAWTIVDTPDGLTYQQGSLQAQLADGTDVTELLTVHDIAGTVVPGNPAFVAEDGTRTDPDLTVSEGGFILEADDVLHAYPNTQLTITYRSTVMRAEAANTATVTTVFADGAHTTGVTADDQSTITTYGFTLTKTSFDNPSARIDGAGFTIKDQDRDAWLSYDAATGLWSEVAEQEAATEFVTGSGIGGKSGDESGTVSFVGLGAGEYLIQETTAPEGFSSHGIAMPSLIATIGGDGTVTFNGQDLPELTTDNGDGSVTVANIANLTALPQTGGAWSVVPWIVGALLTGGAGIGAIRIGRRIRRWHADHPAPAREEGTAI